MDDNLVSNYIDVLIDPFTLITYKNVSFIGIGSSSVCYLFVNESTKENVVIKIVKKSNKMLRLIGNEITIHSSLNHPNIVKLLSNWEDDKNWYLVLEYCANGQLTNKKCAEDTAKKVLKQLINALIYLHSNQIIHRDIKPANILLDTEFNVKLADFGLAKRIGNKYIKGYAGTPNFMAPEVYQEWYSYPVDAWSFGCVMYYILMAKPPFKAVNKRELEQVVKTSKKHEISASCEANQLINELLDVNPDTRKSIISIATSPFFSDMDITVGKK